MKKFNSLVQKILLAESPVIVDNPLLINLNNKSTNEEAVEKSFQEGEKLDSFEGRDVYKISEDGLLYFCFIDNNIADAYVEFLIDDGEVKNKRVLQRKSDNSKGFMRRIFLNYFSRIFQSIKLDSVANKKGKEFFKKLLKEAIEKGFKTTVVNEKTKEEEEYKEKNFEQYWSSWSGKGIINDKEEESYNILFKIYFQ